MDQTMVDVGKEEGKEGEEVVIIGSQGKQEITVREIARKLNTFENEIVSRISDRVTRVYFQKGKIIKVN